MFRFVWPGLFHFLCLFFFVGIMELLVLSPSPWSVCSSDFWASVLCLSLVSFVLGLCVLSHVSLCDLGLYDLSLVSLSELVLNCLTLVSVIRPSSLCLSLVSFVWASSLVIERRFLVSVCRLFVEERRLLFIERRLCLLSVILESRFLLLNFVFYLSSVVSYVGLSSLGWGAERRLLFIERRFFVERYPWEAFLLSGFIGCWGSFLFIERCFLFVGLLSLG